MSREIITTNILKRTSSVVETLDLKQYPRGGEPGESSGGVYLVFGPYICEIGEANDVNRALQFTVQYAEGTERRTCGDGHHSITNWQLWPCLYRGRIFKIDHGDPVEHQVYEDFIPELLTFHGELNKLYILRRVVYFWLVAPLCCPLLLIHVPRLFHTSPPVVMGISKRQAAARRLDPAHISAYRDSDDDDENNPPDDYPMPLTDNKGKKTAPRTTLKAQLAAKDAKIAELEAANSAFSADLFRLQLDHTTLFSAHQTILNDNRTLFSTN
ncbi:hypothetical protein B0H17DRAFT_1142402 [Mycena rosella]|uniref:Uncharacterized protein n=1 Tax=Mycena rosella TaxID=1033263 RepID=A0AAD7CXV4_MYCRO|nr:hypothetical protein B0H17DRAFT_1142402 [Mycena rosella]